MTVNVTTKTQASNDKPVAERRPGPVARLLQSTGRVVRLLLASLLISIAIEWLGMHFWWPELGAEHSRQMLQTESRFLQRNVDNSWLEMPSVIALKRSAASAAASVADSGFVAVAKEGLHRPVRYLATQPRWQRWRVAATPYLQASENIARLYAIRLTVLFLTAPLFVLLAWVGLVDGLVQRDLRRWGGGRESAYVYHYAKRSNLLFVAIGAILYLALPVSVHPAIVLMPFASACAISVSLTASRFKKYL